MMCEKIAFVGQQNAGKSQLATALAEHKSADRGLDVSIVTGGVAPADRIQPDIVTVLDELGLEIGDRTPRKIHEDIGDADYVATIGCSICDFKPLF